ncbi:MAG: hypothetical protein ACE5E0_03455 [Terriglobia bacterium]
MPTYPSDFYRGTGKITAAHSAISATATSNEIDVTGYNSILLECVVTNITTGNWVAEVLGALTSEASAGSIHRFTEAAAGAMHKLITPSSGTGFMNADGTYTFLFEDLPNFIKIKATRTTDGTITCRVQPIRT